jgi:hypothetical protein
MITTMSLTVTSVTFYTKWFALLDTIFEKLHVFSKFTKEQVLGLWQCKYWTRFVMICSWWRKEFLLQLPWAVLLQSAPTSCVGLASDVTTSWLFMLLKTSKTTPPFQPTVCEIPCYQFKLREGGEVGRSGRCVERKVEQDYWRLEESDCESRYNRWKECWTCKRLVGIDEASANFGGQKILTTLADHISARGLCYHHRGASPRPFYPIYLLHNFNNWDSRLRFCTLSVFLVVMK